MKFVSQNATKLVSSLRMMNGYTQLLRERRIERLRHMEMKILTERVVVLLFEIKRLRDQL